MSCSAKAKCVSQVHIKTKHSGKQGHLFKDFPSTHKEKSTTNKKEKTLHSRKAIRIQQ